MAGNSLFDQDKNGNTDDLSNLTGEDALKTYVGEEAKFKSVEDLAKAYAHLNAHAGKVEQENGTLREEVQKAKSVDEVLAELRNQSQDTSPSPTSDNSDTSGDDKKQEPSVAELVQAELDKRDQAQSVQDVANKLKQQFGDKAGELYRAKGEELGIDLDELAAKSPQAVLSLFAQAPQNQQPLNSYGSGNQNAAPKGDAIPDEMTKEGLDKLHASGAISREEKFRRQHEALTKVGADKFYGRT